MTEQFSSGPTITIPAARVVTEMAKGITFSTVELAIAARLTGWRRVAMYGIAAHNIARTIQTGVAVTRYVKSQEERP